MPVLENITCTIPPWKVTSIVGMSGVWKSTLLHMILWNVKVDHWTITLSNIPQGSYLQENTIAYVSQKYNSFPWLTVAENIALWNNCSKKIHNDTMKKLWLYEVRNKYPDFLSWGQQQRVSLARAFLQSANIIALDEPFSSLDWYVRDQLYKIVLSLMREQNKTVILITHDIEEAIYLSDQVIVLKGSPWKIVYTHQLSYWDYRAEDIRYSQEFINSVKKVSHMMI